MKNIVITTVAIILVLVFAVPVSAAQPAGNHKVVNPKTLEAVFIHYDHPAKPNKPGTEPPPAINDYFQKIGPAWDLSKYQGGIKYVINPSGAPLGAKEVVIGAFEAWDNATSREMFHGNPEIDYNSWWGKEDGKNNVSWQNLGSGSIIAATWIWYQDNDGSGTMTTGDEVLENDIVFNASMRWGIDADGEGTAYSLKNMYDIRNIATHEVGHIVGLDDLYDLAYRDITMYGYSTKSETKKISLQVGDTWGISALYP